MVNHQLIDSMMHDLDGLWTTDTPHDDLHIYDLRLGPNVPGARVDHRDVCAMEPSVREAARDRFNSRIPAFGECPADLRQSRARTCSRSDLRSAESPVRDQLHVWQHADGAPRYGRLPH